MKIQKAYKSFFKISPLRLSANTIYYTLKKNQQILQYFWVLIVIIKILNKRRKLMKFYFK